MCINTLYVRILYTWFHLFPRAGSTCDRSTLRARSLLAAGWRLPACACAGPPAQPGSRHPASRPRGGGGGGRGPAAQQNERRQAARSQVQPTKRPFRTATWMPRSPL
jgi:hypothetical protein